MRSLSYLVSVDFSVEATYLVLCVFRESVGVTITGPVYIPYSLVDIFLKCFVAFSLLNFYMLINTTDFRTHRFDLVSFRLNIFLFFDFRFFDLKSILPQ